MKNITSIRLTLFTFLVVIMVLSCKKGMDNEQTPPLVTPPDLSTKISSSVSGFVTDENEVAVKDATVQVGTSTIQTDKYGFFEATNVQVVQNAAVVTVFKAGYFKIIKTYIAEVGKPVFFRIKLITGSNSGTISSSTGGTISLPNNLSINFPANAFVNTASNAAYSGTVTVSAIWLDPTRPDLDRVMPGDLRGLNTAGNLQLLTTYGMAGVELTGSGGELLQIAAGKKATLSFPIPAAISGSAPASIPLWFFDEVKGLWKQEGIATKSGNNYVGDVSHFTFWNCDVPGNYVQFNCTVISSNGQPVPNVPVKISVVSNPASARTGYTNAAGYVSGAVPDNQQLLLEVLTNNCYTTVFSKTFTTTNVSVSLGNVTIPAVSSAIATVSGTVLNCANSPVTNGYIMLKTGGDYNRYTLSSSGTYSFNMLVCQSSNTISLVGEDITTSKRSIPADYSIAPGNNPIPDIQACAVSFAVGNMIGYFYHPSSPHPMNQNKNVVEISPNTYQIYVGDLPTLEAILMVNPVTNLISISGSIGINPLLIVQFDNGLPTTSPGYLPAWAGSNLCNNTYDPIQRKFKLRYGYMGASGYRVSEEIITLP